jgi:hypothetical protein
VTRPLHTGFDLLAFMLMSGPITWPHGRCATVGSLDAGALRAGERRRAQNGIRGFRFEGLKVR